MTMMTSIRGKILNVLHGDRKRQGGFSLVELSVSMMVIGILVASFAYPYSVWVKKQKHETTVENVEQMAFVVAAFRSANGRYPCPAPLDIPRDDPAYGFETDCTDDTEAPVGGCHATSGVCGAQSLRTLTGLDIDSDGTVDPDMNPRIRIGSIPFRSLNISEEEAHDGYGSKIIYAVTEVQATNSANPALNYPMNPLAGGISVEYDDAGGNRRSRVEPPGSADFVVVSHGPDKEGSFRKSGEIFGGNACDEATDDGENCDHANGNPDSIFFSSERVTGDTNDQNDDMVLFQMPLNAPFWARSSENPHDIFSIRSIGTDGAVGGDWLYNWHLTNSPGLYDDAKMWVGGNVLVEGDTQARQYCLDDDDTTCFPADMIGGTGVQCDPNTGPVTRIAGADVHCDGGNLTVECPAGEVVRGFDEGELYCANMPCPLTDVVSCSQTFYIPAGEDGATYIFWSGGGNLQPCQHNVYSCTNGQWTLWLGNDNSWCTCTPSATPYDVACGGGCTGTRTFEDRTECDFPCTNYTTIVAGACDCPPPGCVDDIEVETESCNLVCPYGGVGSVSVTTETICNPPDTIVSVVDDCICNPPGSTCTPSTDTVSDPCDAGCSGTIDTTTTVTCSPDNVDVTVVNNCTNCCVEEVVETFEECSPGCDGSIITTTTTECNPGPVDTVEVVNDCVCQPPPCTGGGGPGCT